MKPSQLYTTLVAAIKKMYPILVKGQPGVGKTDIVYQAAKAVGYRVIVTHPVVSDPTDFKGLPGIADGKAEFLPFGDLREMIEAKRYTVVFIDDLGQAPPAVQAACMQLILARRINGHEVSKYVTFVAATNRKQDRAGVSGILEPVKSRFYSIVELEPDVDDWVEWALNNNISTPTIAFNRFRPHFITEFKASADLTNSPSPRTIVNADKILGLGLPESVEYEVLRGAAGDMYATELTGFLKIYKQLPSPQSVLLAPDKAEVPTDPATLYALVGALVRMASEQNAGNLFKYANRLPDEFSVLLAHDAIRTVPEIQKTRGFISWASKHKDIII